MTVRKGRSPSECHPVLPRWHVKGHVPGSRRTCPWGMRRAHPLSPVPTPGLAAFHPANPGLFKQILPPAPVACKGRVGFEMGEWYGVVGQHLLWFAQILVKGSRLGGRLEDSRGIWLPVYDDYIAPRGGRVSGVSFEDIGFIVHL